VIVLAETVTQLI